MIACLMMDLETDQDRVEFRTLYEKTVVRFLTIAKSILHNQEDAEETVHDIYTEWMKNYAVYKKKPFNEMEALGVVMVRNKAINLRNRKEKYMEDTTDDVDILSKKATDEDESMLDGIVRQETIGEVKKAIRGLTEDEQALLKLRYELEMSIREISNILHIKENTVKVKLQRIRKKLYVELKEVPGIAG